MSRIRISSRTVYYTSFALAVSIFANLFGMAADLGLFQLGRSSLSLPISPRPAALKYMGAENDPIHGADEWESLYPPGKGFVQINGSYFLVSMYHQMHCINSFRRGIEEYRAGTNLTELRKIHLTHCLSYLRQAVLCNADISLEQTSLRHTIKGEPVHAAYGTGATHECRDWTEVYDWAQHNHLEWAAEDDFEIV